MAAPIGVEFAGFSSLRYRGDHSGRCTRLFGRYDEDVAQVAREIIADQDILIPACAYSPSRTALTHDRTYLDRGATRELEVDYVMVATGRKPATEGGLENTSIETNDRGAIVG